MMLLDDLRSRPRSGLAIVRSDALANADAWISDSERATAAGFRLDRRRDEWLLGRLAAKQLALELGLCTVPRECAVPTRGVRPTLLIRQKPTDLFLSLSHTEGVAAAAISPSPIGVDVQIERTVTPDATRFFLNDEESDLFDPHTGSPLLDLWSAKEAALKAAGVERYREVRLRADGMNRDNRRFRFDAGGASGRVETGRLDEGSLVLAVAWGG